MRRSTTVFAPLLASAATALLTGCSPQMQRCVDESNHVVDQKFCQAQGQYPNQNAQSPIYLGPPHIYRYYYGGGGSYGFGSVVSGGSFTPHAGTSYSLTHGTTRGGFGSFFSGGGEGEGGGHGAGE